MRFYLSIFLGAFFFLSAGCASHVKAPVAKTEPAPPPHVMPFALSVEQELNDGKRLYVRAAIEAHADWNTGDAALKLVGYKNGEHVGEQIAPLSVLGPVLHAGEKKSIPIVLEAADITDYQLELLWGKEAVPLVNAQEEQSTTEEPQVELRNLVITSRRINCTEATTCQLKFAISADLFNATEKVIFHAVLGTGFIWTEGAPLDLSKSIPQNESRIELPGLALGPGASRRVQLDLDRTVPERSDGAFRPVLRVISFDAAGPAASK